jgi:hypothetical protein
LLLALVVTARTEDDVPLVSTGLNALPEIEFANLSQQDLNPLGAKALAIHPEQWKHGETEHFIYHFTRSFVATSVSVEAEFHYRVVAKALEREQPPGDTKSHIYVFDKTEDWEQFQTLGQLEKWTGGIHSLGSLFIKRDPRARFAGNTLGHEISHLVMHRFYSEGIPTWLDEGFAQYVSKGARASYQRARGYIAKPHSQSIVAEDLIPLPALVAFTGPPSDRVAIFYDESERLVRFLVATDKPTFLLLLDALGKHQPFQTAFARIYAGRFASAAIFEERFREYASKDAASQDSDNG